jgi:hypothetical protein
LRTSGPPATTKRHGSKRASYIGKEPIYASTLFRPNTRSLPKALRTS